MPFIYEDTIQGERRNALTIPSARSDVLTEQFAQSFEENPIMAVTRFSQLAEDQVTGPRLSADTARARLKNAGMENDLVISDSGITEAALLTLMDRKRVEKRRQEIFARSEGGAGELAGRFGVAIATTLTDPISAGLNFVPIVGQVRYARWLNAARSMGGRLAVRAGVGAAEGAAGAAIAEIPIYAMRTQEQADYDMGDSLLNVAFGGVIGSGLHTTVGSAAELIGSSITERRIPRDSSLPSMDAVTERRFARQIAENVNRAIEEYAKVPGSDGSRVLNTDLARELSPEYRADRTRSAAVHEPASWIVKQMYERKLSEPVGSDQYGAVLFSAGGTGAGKTTGIEMLSRVDPRVARAQIIYDTNMNGLKSSATKIDKALEAGREVRIVYTWRDPVDALVNGALPRAMRMGRTVPLEEHAKTHVGAARTIKELAERYKNDSRVQIDVIDNSRGKGKAELGEIARIPELEYNAVREALLRALEAERAAGRISEAVYRGTAGKSAQRAGNRAGDGEGPQSGSPVVDRISAASPEAQQAALRTAVAQAVAGRPINVDVVLDGLPADIQRLLIDPVDPEARAAVDVADEVLARDFEPTTDAALKAAEDEATLATADLQSLAKRLEIDVKGDSEMATVMEGIEKAERWARVAELATVCLVRGG